MELDFNKIIRLKKIRIEKSELSEEEMEAFKKRISGLSVESENGYSITIPCVKFKGIEMVEAVAQLPPEIQANSEEAELLLKERPNDNDKWILGKIKEFVADNCKLSEEKIEAKDSWDFARNFFNYLKIIDKEFYKEMLKYVCDEKAKKDAEKAKMEKARAIKNLNKE